MSLTKLCMVTKSACDILAPMILNFYGAINSETAKLKSDASVFTIADGVVQVGEKLTFIFILLYFMHSLLASFERSLIRWSKVSGCCRLFFYDSQISPLVLIIFYNFRRRR